MTKRLRLANEEKQRKTAHVPFAFNLDNKVMEHIFVSEFPKLDLSTCSESGARLFARWLIEINLRLKTIKIVDEQPHAAEVDKVKGTSPACKDVLVQRSLISRMERTFSRSKSGELSSSQIIGLDFAWVLATSGHSEKVANFATSLLSALHVQLSPELDKEVRQKLRGDFVRTCLERINDVQKMRMEGRAGKIDSGGRAEGARGGAPSIGKQFAHAKAEVGTSPTGHRVLRCLSLLKSFLERQAKHEEERCENIKINAIIHGELSFRFKDCLLLSDAELFPSALGVGDARSEGKTSPRLAPEEHVLSVGASFGQVCRYM